MNERCKTCQKTVHRTEEETKNLTKRLNIIEGQIRGINGMVKDNRHCEEIIIQIAAVTKSLKSIGDMILQSHMEKCVSREIKCGNDKAILDALSLFNHLNK